MVELGIYGIARVHWTVYPGALAPHREAVGGVFLAVGAVSAVLGGVMCLAQRHLKRLLAFSTISHMGMLLIAVGLMDSSALAGAAVYTVAHGLVKGALFLLAGILLHCLGTVDEHELRGRGRRMPVTAIAFVLGVIGLAGIPPFGTGLGKALIEHAGRRAGRGWIAVPLIAGSSMTAAAVLRVFGRAFLGLGSRGDGPGDATRGDETRETRSKGGRAPWVMPGPVFVLLLLSGLSGLVSPWMPRIEQAARGFTDSSSYHASVLDGFAIPWNHGSSSATEARLSVSGTVATAAAALGMALVALFADRVPDALLRAVSGLDRLLLRPLRAVHSGKIGDYITWLTLGVAAFGLVVAFLTGVLLFPGLR